MQTQSPASTGPRIERVAARLFRVPLDEVLSDAKHGDHTHFELVTATVRLSDGREGTGYTYTGGRGGRAILAMIEDDLAPFVIGRDAGDISALNDGMQMHVHYVGRGGVAAFAISAVDIALWDLKGKAAALPLWRMAGARAPAARPIAAASTSTSRARSWCSASAPISMRASRL